MMVMVVSLSATTDPPQVMVMMETFFINTATSKIFGPKASGSWPAGVSLVGAQGDKGEQGEKGVQGLRGGEGKTGEKGDPGGWTRRTGPAGSDGKTILNGTSDPDDTNDGVDGDFLLTLLGADFWAKESGNWPWS